MKSWLPALELNGIGIGEGRLDIRVRRGAERTEIERIDGHGVEVVTEMPEAALWGRPPKLPTGAPAGGDHAQ